MTAPSNRTATTRATLLATQLASLPEVVRQRLHRHRFDPDRFSNLSARLRTPHGLDNRVKGRVEPLAPGQLAELPASGSAEAREFTELGQAALSAGECAVVVLAGGMATRMGGVVKALVEAVPEHTFLDLRLREQEACHHRYGQRPPLWLMTSAATDAPTRAALGTRVNEDTLACFVQGLSLRMTPDGDLFHTEDGQVSEHAPGHGDLPDALEASGLLQRFVQRGGRTVMLANLDNLGATLDPTILGFHLAGQQQVTSEVVDKVGSDRGGIPVLLDDTPVVLEEFRLPESFDPSSVPVFNVNTFWFDARALLELELDWTYFAVTKKVEERPAVQFERIVNEVTFELQTRYLHVPRSGAASRFLPVKDFDELAERRPQIEEVCRARGIL